MECAVQSSGVHSLSVYGLVVRLVPFYEAAAIPSWRHAFVLPNSLANDHPVAPRYSNTLLETYRATQRVIGVVTANDADRWPSVKYVLSPDQEYLIRKLHASSHWVITADRFFALDYYDSPQNKLLEDQARTYLLNYAPEFADGIGQRMFITTQWRHEVELLLAAAMRDLGFEQVDESVGTLLHYLNMLSGQLALQLTRSDTSAAAAVGLGVVAAQLMKSGELESSVLIPIDTAPRLFSRTMTEGTKKGERRCDLVLLTMKRNTLEATFIEVKWRRGTSSFDSLATEMEVQMRSTAKLMQERYFNFQRNGKDVTEQRADGVLQRAYFANVVRFYVDRAHRYGLLNEDAYRSFNDHLRNIERPTYEFRPVYRGYIVTMEKGQAQPIIVGDAAIQVISPTDIALLSPNTPALSVEDADEAMQTPRDVPTPQPATSLTEEKNQSSQRASPQLNGTPEETADIDTPVTQQSPTPPREISVALGETLRGPVAWNPSIKGSPHLFIVGIPGQGKSVTTNHILMELARQHLPALVLDFHGQFADEKYALASGSQVIDAEQGLPFSPFEVMVQNGKADWKQNSSAIADIFAYVVGLGGIQKDLLLNAIQDAYKLVGFATGSADDLVLPTTEQVLRNIEQREQKQKVRNVAARCRPLLEMDLFKPSLNGSNVLAQIRHGLVIDLHHLMSDSLQLAAGAFILRKLYRDMFAWGQTDYLRLAIVLDEAHRLAKDVTLPKLMREGRKFGISVVVASQSLSDFHPDILNNVGAKIVFRTNYPESKKIAPYIQPRNPKEMIAQIEQLAVGNAVVQTLEMPQGVVVRMRASND